MGSSKSLPSMYTIRGLRAAQGLIFLDSLSAFQWLAANLPEGTPEHVTVGIADVIYYSGSLGGKSIEEVQAAKNRA